MDGQSQDAQRTGTIKLPSAGAEAAAARRAARPEWVEEARGDLAAGGRYLAFEESGRRTVVPVSREWTRIGRSLGADLRFDDATVSRRHALVAVDEHGARVLDDRSLNGITVNGARVDTSPLTDGDEIGIGRHILFYLEGVPAPRAGEPAASTLAR